MTKTSNDKNIYDKKCHKITIAQTLNYKVISEAK